MADVGDPIRVIEVEPLEIPLPTEPSSPLEDPAEQPEEVPADA